MQCILVAIKSFWILNWIELKEISNTRITAKSFRKNAVGTTLSKAVMNREKPKWSCSPIFREISRQNSAAVVDESESSVLVWPFIKVTRSGYSLLLLDPWNNRPEIHIICRHWIKDFILGFRQSTFLCTTLKWIEKFRIPFIKSGIPASNLGSSEARNPAKFAAWCGLFRIVL